MTFISDIITELFTYRPTYLSGGEGVGEKTNTGDLSNEGEGMNMYTSSGARAAVAKFITSRILAEFKNFVFLWCNLVCKYDLCW
jgi:hypothetical protein